MKILRKLKPLVMLLGPAILFCVFYLKNPLGDEGLLFGSPKLTLWLSAFVFHVPLILLVIAAVILGVRDWKERKRANCSDHHKE
jgi:hypothetical protein